MKIEAGLSAGGRLLREEFGGLIWTTGAVHVDRRCGGEPGERVGSCDGR